ncbi:MAG TPA: carotenoid biosynthesis protein [Vicinamibacteria bacterium]|nr:carotenoid biosynthesis protein [Vicinamibacteria bacterium]
MSAPPAWAHELLLAPAVLALAVVHARRALGLPRALVEAGVLTLYGYALEWIAIRAFRAHDYAGAWHVAPGGVPVAVAAVWASVILCTLTLAARLGLRTAGGRAAAAALVALSLDLLMEPVAVRLGLWRWTPPGAWLGVPLGNFVGWAVIVAGWCLGVERDPCPAPLVRVAARRAVLATASIAALLLVGWAWRAGGVERAAGALTGWIAAAGVWALALFLAGRRRPAAAWPDTLAGRLGRTAGLAPEAALVILVLAFAADAVADGDGALRVVAAMAAAAVGFVSLASGRSAPIT